MSYDQLVALLREFGFPVVVACWFMWRLEKRMDRLFELMGSLSKSSALLAKSIDYLEAANRRELERKRDEP